MGATSALRSLRGKYTSGRERRISDGTGLTNYLLKVLCDTEKSTLHLRVALLTIRLVGTKPAQIVLGLMIASAVCSAYMLPVATPSNVVAFGSGEISIKQMVRAGLWLNLISLGTIMLTLYTLVPLVFGTSL